VNGAMTGLHNAEAIAELRKILAMQLQSEADSRRVNAEEYHDDKRHAAAAEQFQKLAATVKDVPNDIFATWVDRWQTIYGSRGAAFEATRRVGFHTSYNSATELVRELIAQGIR
jgi:hypothetical protein